MVVVHHTVALLALYSLCSHGCVLADVHQISKLSHFSPIIPELAILNIFLIFAWLIFTKRIINNKKENKVVSICYGRHCLFYVSKCLTEVFNHFTSLSGASNYISCRTIQWPFMSMLFFHIHIRFKPAILNLRCNQVLKHLQNSPF